MQQLQCPQAGGRAAAQRRPCSRRAFGSFPLPSSSSWRAPAAQQQQAAAARPVAVASKLGEMPLFAENSLLGGGPGVAEVKVSPRQKLEEVQLQSTVRGKGGTC